MRSPPGDRDLSPDLPFALGTQFTGIGDRTAPCDPAIPQDGTGAFGDQKVRAGHRTLRALSCAPPRGSELAPNSRALNTLSL